jgi:hypothetical protein
MISHKYLSDISQPYKGRTTLSSLLSEVENIVDDILLQTNHAEANSIDTQTTLVTVSENNKSSTSTIDHQIMITEHTQLSSATNTQSSPMIDHQAPADQQTGIAVPIQLSSVTNNQSIPLIIITPPEGASSVCTGIQPSSASSNSPITNINFNTSTVDCHINPIPSGLNPSNHTDRATTDPLLSSNNVVNLPLGTTVHRKTKPKSVSFQTPAGAPSLLAIPEEAEDTWRLTRANLSNAARARARAQHFQTLIDSNSIPYWALGLEPSPPYIRDIIPEITRLRRLQAVELLQTVISELRTRATRCERIGQSLRQVTLPALFSNRHEDLRKALAKIDSLVQRDEQDVRTLLANQRETIRTQVITDEMVNNAILSLQAPSDARAAPTPRSRSRSRSPGARGRGSPRGRGRGYPRGPTRGRGAPAPPTYNAPPRGRGRARARGRGSIRGRGNQANQNNTLNLNQAELAVINAIRNNTNNQQ